MGNKSSRAVYTKHAQQAKEEQTKEDQEDEKQEQYETINIDVEVNKEDPFSEEKFADNFSVSALYSPQETMKDVLDQIIQHLEEKHYPLRLQIVRVEKTSFCGSIRDTEQFTAIYARSITEYEQEKLSQKGLSVTVDINNELKILNSFITCKHMTEQKTDDPLKCPIYSAMKEKYKFTEKNLQHLTEFTHFRDEFGDKPLCKYSDECNVFLRQERGGADRLDDKCHMKLFKHPPRTRNIKLAQNVNSLVINTEKKQNCSLYKPDAHDRAKYGWNVRDGFLKALIEEVVVNGFKYDLCLECGASDECNHDKFGILGIVNQKMKHFRHQQMSSPLSRDRMLALILYTGCDCNYDLCTSQRNGDYAKWKWFDYCLWWAIEVLSHKESGSFSVFSGLNGVKLDKKMVESGYFVTYVSTSWNKEVAHSFMGGNKGMIIQFDEEYKNAAWIYCCDVSWISKFPDECEILFARSLNWTEDKFKCVILDESNGVQTVSLRQTEM